MRHFFAAAAMTAVVVATGGIAHAQTAPSASDVQQAEQLASKIDADIAALGPNPTQDQVQTVMSTDAAMSGLSANVVVLATQAVRVANPNSPAVQNAAISVATTALVASGVPQATAASQAAAAPSQTIVTATAAAQSGGSQVASTGSGTGSGTSSGTGNSSGSTGAPTGGSAGGGGSSYR